MTVSVITPPEPFMTPGDIPGDHEADDEGIAALIAAAIEQIDGPNGWLGRAIGPQRLELSGWFGCERIRLPSPPIIEIDSVVTEDGSGNRTTVDASQYRLDGDCLIVAPGASWASQPVHRIRYNAGYNGRLVSDGGTGDIPASVKQAVILMVREMQDTGSVSADLKVDEIVGVSRQEYFTSRSDSATLNRTAERLLAGLRVYR